MRIKSIQSSVLSSKFLPILIGIICIVATSWPIFHSGFFRPHDYTHAARIVEMNRSLTAGELPVRWSENFGFGYGMPLFNFYAPLPYYVAQIPYSLTHDAILSIKFLYLLNSFLAFTGMYLLAKSIGRIKRLEQSALLFLRLRPIGRLICTSVEQLAK